MTEQQPETSERGKINNLPDTILPGLRTCFRSIYEHGVDFSAVTLNLVEQAFNTRKLTGMPVEDKMITSIYKVLLQITQQIRVDFSKHQDEFIDQLGLIFAGVKGIKTLDEKIKYGYAPNDERRKSINYEAEVDKNEGIDNKSSILERTKVKRCTRKLKTQIETIEKWTSKKKEFDEVFNLFEGNKRNFEAFNKFIAGASQKIELQNFLILPLTNTKQRKSLGKLLNLQEPTGLTTVEQQVINHQEKVLTDASTYNSQIKPINTANLEEYKNSMKDFDPDYQSYRTAFDDLKPVYDDYQISDTSRMSIPYNQIQHVYQPSSQKIIQHNQPIPLQSKVSNIQNTTNNQVPNYAYQPQIQVQRKFPPIQSTTYKIISSTPLNDYQYVPSSTDRQISQTGREHQQSTQSYVNPYNNLVDKIQVNPKSSGRLINNNPSQSDLQKTQPFLIASPTTGQNLHRMQNMTTPNHRVNQFSAGQTGSIMTSPSPNKQSINIQSESIRQVTPPKNQFALSHYNQHDQKRNKSKEDNPTNQFNFKDDFGLQSPSRDDPGFQSDNTSVYSYDSNLNTLNRNSSPIKQKENNESRFKLNPQKIKQESVNKQVTFDGNSEHLETNQRTPSKNVAKFELPIYTTVCLPEPAPLMEEAFFLSTMELPQPITQGSKIQHQFDSLNGSLVDLNIGNIKGVEVFTQISLSPSYRTPSTEGIYCTNQEVYYINIIKHNELKSPETRIKIKQLVQDSNIGDCAYFGQSELAFIYEKNKQGVLAVDLNGNKWSVCDIKQAGQKSGILKSIVSAQYGQFTEFRNSYLNTRMSPQRHSTNLRNLQHDGHDTLYSDNKLKELLLVKIDNNTLDVVYGFDHTFTTTQSTTKSKLESQKRFMRARICELNPTHGEISDFFGYWVQPNLSSSSNEDNPIPEARVYILGSHGYIGIYSIKFDSLSSPEVLCVKEIELETGNKVKAVKFTISDPQVIGDWANEQGFSQFKTHHEYDITYEYYSRIIAISFESYPGSRKFKQSIFFFRILPETYSFDLLYHHKLKNDTQNLENSETKISNFSLNFDGFLLISYPSKLEIFSFRHETGKVRLNKETEYSGKTSQFQHGVHCQFEREDSKGRLWWVNDSGTLSSLEEGWGMSEFKAKERLHLENYQPHSF